MRTPDESSLLQESQLDAAEARMRAHLTLPAGGVRHGEGHGHPTDGRSNGNGSGTRTRPRFVQDGDVPVTVLNRHRQPPGGALSPGTAVAALAAEQTARTKAERSLQEALATIRDMQTKHGHAELARREAADAARAEQETLEALRAEQIARLREELAAERTARAAAEAERDEAIAARLRIERELQAALIAKAPPPAEARPAPTPRTRKIAPAARTPEPQPVKWWLKSGAKR